MYPGGHAGPGKPPAVAKNGFPQPRSNLALCKSNRHQFVIITSAAKTIRPGGLAFCGFSKNEIFSLIASGES